MKRFILYFSLVFTPLAGFSINFNKTTKIENQLLAGYLNQIVDVFYKVDSANKQIYNILPLYKAPDDSTDLFYAFVEDNYNYSYTLMSYALNSPPENLTYNSIHQVDSIIEGQRREYINALLNNKVYMNALKYYLTNQSDKTYDITKDTVALDELIDITSKYFYVFEIIDNHDFKYAVCGGGVNPYRQIPGLSTNILAESFAFQALGNYMRDNISIFKDLDRTIKPQLIESLQKLDESLDDDAKLRIIRNQMWETMRDKEYVKNSILVEYARSTDIVPIVLKK